MSYLDRVAGVETLRQGDPLLALPAGSILQVKSTVYSTQTSGTTTFPLDNTIPQQTEGTEIMSVSITPSHASNRLLIMANVVLGGSTSLIGGPALFQDSTANALAFSEHFNSGAGVVTPITLIHEMAAGTTSATTFKIRIGMNGGTWYVNYRSNGETFGGIIRSALTVFEIKV